MLVESGPIAGLKQAQLSARVAEVAGKVVHTLGVVLKIQVELKGVLLYVPL